MAHDHWALPTAPEDYMVYIDSIRQSCLRKYQPDDPYFPVYFICTLQENFSSGICLRLSQQQQPQLASAVHHWIERYFLQFFSPQEVPNLYAAMMLNLSSCTNLLSIGKPPKLHNRVKRQSLRYLESAHKYMTMHRNQAKQNQQTAISKYVQQKHNKMESPLAGKILSHLARVYFDSLNWSQGIEHQNKCIVYFLGEQASYTVYSGLEALDFVMDLIKRLLLFFDYVSQCSYQRKWEYLLKHARKTLRHYPRAICFDRYGRCYLYLAVYYFLWNATPNNLRKAEKYLLRCIRKIRRFDPHHPTLTFAFEWLVHLYRTFGHHHKCKKWLEANIDLIQHTSCELDEWDQSELENIKKGRLGSIAFPMRKMILNTRREMTVSVGLESAQLSKWRQHFRNKRSYQIMQNICSTKECNLWQCKRKDVRLNTCARCRSVFYCSRKHQKIDWKLGHRNECQANKHRSMKYTMQKDWSAIMVKELPECSVIFEKTQNYCSE